MRNDDKRKLQIDLQILLENKMKEGVLLYLEGSLSSPQEIVNQHCVQEDTVYMTDYIIDDAGKLLEMRFDKVVHK